MSHDGRTMTNEQKPADIGERDQVLLTFGAKLALEASASPKYAADFVAAFATALERRDRIEREPVVVGETYYDRGKDAEYFEKLNDKDFSWALTCASQDLNDSDENVSQWMPVSALLSSAADRITALASAPERVADLWHELCNRSDRTSPEEYPDMCLITREELADFISRASPSTPVVTITVEQAKALIYANATVPDRLKASAAVDAQLAALAGRKA